MNSIHNPQDWQVMFGHISTLLVLHFLNLSSHSEHIQCRHGHASLRAFHTGTRYKICTHAQLHVVIYGLWTYLDRLTTDYPSYYVRSDKLTVLCVCVVFVFTWCLARVSWGTKPVCFNKCLGGFCFLFICRSSAPYLDENFQIFILICVYRALGLKYARCQPCV